MSWRLKEPSTPQDEGASAESLSANMGSRQQLLLSNGQSFTEVLS